MSDSQLIGPTVKPSAGMAEYLAMMRLDHVTKHVFIVPGVVLAFLLRPPQPQPRIWPFVAGILAAILCASANYVVNEWLDRGSDVHHPTKAGRAAVRARMIGPWVIAEWILLAVSGVGIAATASLSLALVAFAFVAQGLVYNVKPLRLKDVVFVDVLAEALNNPIRLMLGWAMVDPGTLAPASVLLGYWLGGAFLMGTKRLSEYRDISASHGLQTLALYRRSFAAYSEASLTASCLTYAVLSGMALAIFFVKYRFEYVLVLPVIALLFGYYFGAALRPGSVVQRPERLFMDRGLMGLILLLTLVFSACTVVDLPALRAYAAQQFLAFGPALAGPPR